MCKALGTNDLYYVGLIGTRFSFNRYFDMLWRFLAAVAYRLIVVFWCPVAPC